MPALLTLIFSFFVILVLRSLFSTYLLAASQLATNSSRPGKVLYSILFFPGVMVHELSHFFAAGLTGVRTGRIDIFPREVDGQLKLGSVEMEKTDIFRSFIVGSAPLFSGLIILYSLISIKAPDLLQSFSFEAALGSVIALEGWQDFLFIYALFSVSNTMILSKNDRQGLLPLAVVAFLIFALGFLMTQESLKQFAFEKLSDVFSALSITLFLVGAGNLIFLIPLFFAVKILERIRKRRVRIKLALLD